MKYVIACTLTLLLVAGCSSTTSYTQDITKDYSYIASVGTAQCQTQMTMSGSLKTNCAQ